MMEQVDRAGAEEFIWAMRTRTLIPHEEETDSWRSRSTKSNTLYDESIKTKKNENTTELHAKILASLVPDEIIYNCNDYAHRDYEVCLLFGDVSGFTDLCEKYNQIGKGGPSRLTQVLNAYIGTMVQEVMSYNGDVLKFSGDAFLAMWKTDLNNSSLQDCVHQALDCALIIQKTHGRYETDVGVFLRVKLAIAAGQAVFSIIGDLKMSHYVVIGSPIWDVKEGEKCANAGEIIVSQSAWDYINPTEYKYEIMFDSIHIKVTGLTQNWRSTQRSMARDEYASKLDLSSNESLMSIAGSEMAENEIFELRPSVGDAVKLSLKEDLRKYILPPIMRGIDMDEPIEYLTEMRHIVIIFINVVTNKIEVHEYVRTVDCCYKIVCNIVDSMEGCVNKVSLFDKDLMFVVIFGFRGFKHELESQRGLKCAMTCYKNIKTVPNVVSTSVAVTTGMTYCGAVGHTLRREYTVISLTVNKAARLMVAYPNKVTCDRDTFLQSKLEARHFILQEFKPLKGIKNVGPVYEFIECDSSVPFYKYPISLFPTLDRDIEIYSYITILKQLKLKEIDPTHIIKEGALIISGGARQGKTRLCDEILYCTPADIPIYRLKLVPGDKHIPYETIFLLFNVPLGLTPTSTLADRESKLYSKLRKMPVPELCCVLNEIFRVNFEKSEMYKLLLPTQKALAITKTLKQLAHVLFSKLWVVVIDDGEYIDDESWPLLETLIQTHKIFVIITLSSNVKLCSAAKVVVRQPGVKHITLNPIDKWYHVGLACQILDVYGIPPELEKVLHGKSNGNPGWIESFLISLVQGQLIEIRTIPVDTIADFGLVIPSKEMMLRTAYPQRLSVFQTRHFPDQTKRDSMAILHDKWRIYQFSYRDSSTELTRDLIPNLISTNMENRVSGYSAVSGSSAGNLRTLEDNSRIINRKKHYRQSFLLPSNNTNISSSLFSDDERAEQTVDICLIIPGSEIEDVDSELSLDVFIMKIFDSLSSYEQLLLKCSAVIGESLPRDMLVYLMNCQEERETSLAVKKLFEIGVLGCAQGEFLDREYDNAIMNPPKGEVEGISCQCIGLVIPASCKNLPKYASCGYLCFKIPSFKETTYNLLTVNQKKEFHTRAVRYLEKKTRRCRVCGGGFFVKILGFRYEEGFKDKSKKVKHKVVKATGSRSSSSILENWETPSKKVSHVDSAQHNEIFQALSSANKKSRDILMESLEGSISPSGIPFKMVNKLRYKESLLRTFSSTSFLNCECPRILSSMYKQIREHCEATDQMEKWMNATLEYANICITSYNVPLAIKILDHALIVIDKKYSLVVKPRENWKVPFIKAKILTQLGRSRMELGQMKEAYQCLESALKHYGYKFPSRKISIKVKIMELRQTLMLYFFSRLGVGTKEGYTAEFCDNISDCLALLCVLFMDLELWNNAEIAALWSLTKALESEKDFPTLITAFSNMIFASIRNRKTNSIVALEVKSLLYCRRYNATVESQDLRAVASLYASIFKARIVRGELTRAIDIGYSYIKIANAITSNTLIFDMFPLLIQVLTMKYKIMEAIRMLVNFDNQYSADPEFYGNTWYYALCVCIHLDTGFQVIPFQQCENYYYAETKNMAARIEVTAEKRYYTALWLWYLRNENYEEAEIWKEKIYPLRIHKHECMVNLFTALYYLEGLILTTAYEMDRKMMLVIEEVFEETERLLKSLEQHAKRIKIIAPRLYHLKAFYVLTKSNDTEAYSLLNYARKLAKKTGNIYEENWINHSEMAWQQNMPDIVYNFWKDHATTQVMDYQELDSNDGKVGYYTLEPPVYL